MSAYPMSAYPVSAYPVSASPDPHRLILSPATRLLWRSPDSVHLELGARRVVVDGVSPALIRALVTRPPAVPVARERVSHHSRAALATLTEAGFLWPRVPDDVRLTPPVPRLAAELRSLAAREGDRAAELLSARRHAAVVVGGGGRAGVLVAALLAASGVGRVHCAASGDVRLPQVLPGGLTPADEGRPAIAATDAALHRAAPEVDTSAAPTDTPPDLTVLALDGPVDDDHRDALHAAGVAHLPVTLAADHGVVGPLVIPGLTSCLRCADLHRHDRDPAWPALAVQLATPTRYGPNSDVALASVVAGVAVLQVLCYLDGGDPAAIDGTLELHHPDWRVRRRTWTAHPDCDCTGP